MHWFGTADFAPLLAGPSGSGYADSKLAMVMYAHELSTRLAHEHPTLDIRVLAVDPGFTASDIWRDWTSGPRKVIGLVWI